MPRNRLEPPSEQPAGLYDFGPLDARAMTSMVGMQAENAAMMSLIDPSMLDPFGGMPGLSMDSGVQDMTMSQAFPTSLAAGGGHLGGVAFGADGRPIKDDPGGDDARTAVAGVESHSGGVGGVGGVGGASTLTDFTKRKEWAASVIEELKDCIKVLDGNGKILFLSPSIRRLTGHDPEDMVGQYLSDFVHPDDSATLMSEMNESISRGNPLRMYYRLRMKDGSYGVFDSTAHAHIAGPQFGQVSQNNKSPFCQAVFMITRPYPKRNVQLLDSFLEHKMEHEGLRRRIAELKREEAEAEAEAGQADQGPPGARRQSLDGRSDMTSSEANTVGTGSTSATAMHYLGVAMAAGGGGGADRSTAGGPSDRQAAEAPLSANAALTRENLEGVAGSRSDSIRDKMARYEAFATTQADTTLEMLTGLRYQDGERSRGITTGHGSPILMQGDAGIALPTGDAKGKRKLKLSAEYVCMDCGTLESPEWRRGPNGPKTLCNACGLRWAKKEKNKPADLQVDD